MTTQRIVNLILRYQEHKSIIKPLFEIFPLEKILESTEHQNLLKEEKGIYALFDSSGKNIYVGQTKKDFYSEIFKTRLNDKPKGNEHIYKSNGKASGKTKIRQEKLTYKEITSFISAYSVDNGHIKDVEALLIRIVANNSMNVKMENFKPNFCTNQT